MMRSLMTMMDIPINIIKDILTETQRKKLIRDCQSFLKDWGPNTPALQTYSELHNHSEFQDVIIRLASRSSEILGKTIRVKRSWINCDNGRREDILWHNHPEADYSLVYYIKTIPFINSGTRFKDKFVRVHQNGAMIFPSSVEHTAPSYPFSWIKRYSMAIDFKDETRS